MQNRFTVRPVPPSVDLETLREYIEDRSTWVDRIAFLPPPVNRGGPADKDEGAGGGEGGGVFEDRRERGYAVGVELSVENYRDGVVNWFNDNREITLVLDADEGSGGERSDDEEASRTERKLAAAAVSKFTIERAAPMTEHESTQLVRLCPLRADDTPSSPRAPQKFGPISLCLDAEGGGGGTGSKLWRGGVLLSRAISSRSSALLPPELFGGKDVLELGAGCAGLPSLTLAHLSGPNVTSSGRGDDNLCPASITASDSVDESVRSLRSTVALNDLHGVMRVDQIDFYRIPKDHTRKYDIIMYADAVYSIEQGRKLAWACKLLLKKTTIYNEGSSDGGEVGVVLSMLPPFRVGVSEHVEAMKKTFGEPRKVDLGGILNDNSEVGGQWDSDIKCVQGGNGSGYRLLVWSASRERKNEV